MGIDGRYFKQERTNRGLVGRHQAGILIHCDAEPFAKGKRGSKKHLKDYWTRLRITKVPAVKSNNVKTIMPHSDTVGMLSAVSVSIWTLVLGTGKLCQCSP